MKYEGEGLFIGLVSYPFYVDGGTLFNDVFEGFFRVQHREKYLESLLPKLDPKLYKPVAYKMFGNHGLAILSLIDDYAFCSRIFNSGHIKVERDAEKSNMYKSVTLTGFSGPFSETESYLRNRADDTFLISETDEKKKRYPFIGIIRIKLKCSLLKGEGDLLVKKIKIRIEELKEKVINEVKEKSGDNRVPNLDSIVVDALDNDELIAIAFSDSIRTLDIYLRDIRRISYSELSNKKNEKKEPIEHVCASCHMSYGYHIDFSFNKPNKNFLEWHRENDFIEGKEEKGSAYSVNCLIETKPGHRNDFCNYLSANASELYDKSFGFNKTVTGGSIVHIRIPFEKVESFYDLTATDSSEFRKHIRRIKLTLNDNQNQTSDKYSNTHSDGEGTTNLLDNKFISSIKDKLTDLGISKIVRERLLSLLDLFNDCGRNKLHLSYFQQLESAVKNIEVILKDYLKGNEPLLIIENKLNEEISSFETAFYNRMHNKMTPNTVLEYGGGIQQFLQAFGFAYKEIVRVFSPEEAERNYALITGVSKESSLRTHIELNINHILYPQLFCVTTWKEGSNFTLVLFDPNPKLRNTENEARVKEIYKAFSVIRSFINNKESFSEILNLMISQTDLMRSDAVYRSLKYIFSPETIKYSMQDYIVYHFAFLRDYELMWRYYWKVFLQTPSVYRRRGEISNQTFLLMLLRLLLVAFRETDPQRKEVINAFVKNQKLKPFDNTLATVWFESFDKVESVARNICRNLQSYGYSKLSDSLVQFSEYQIIPEKAEGTLAYAEYLTVGLDDATTTLKVCNTILENRSRRVRDIVNRIENGSFDDSLYNETIKSPDNVITLMEAFLIVIDNLDRKGKKNEIITHTVPRSFSNGEIDYDIIEMLLPHASNILADPIGGFIIPDHNIRKDYFAYRTLLYRTLWNLSYRSL